eukprot:jgi/Mesen1/10424/ME000082S09933
MAPMVILATVGKVIAGGALASVILNGVAYRQYADEFLKPFPNPIDESQEILAEFPIEKDVDDGGFVFGLATAPAHVEDQLDDAWLEFAKETKPKVLKTEPIEGVDEGWGHDKGERLYFDNGTLKSQKGDVLAGGENTSSGSGSGGGSSGGGEGGDGGSGEKAKGEEQKPINPVTDLGESGVLAQSTEEVVGKAAASGEGNGAAGGDHSAAGGDNSGLGESTVMVEPADAAEEETNKELASSGVMVGPHDLAKDLGHQVGNEAGEEHGWEVVGEGEDQVPKSTEFPGGGGTDRIAGTMQGGAETPQQVADMAKGKGPHASAESAKKKRPKKRTTADPVIAFSEQFRPDLQGRAQKLLRSVGATFKKGQEKVVGGGESVAKKVKGEEEEKPAVEEVDDESDLNVTSWHNVPIPEERLRFWSDPIPELLLAKATGAKVYRLGIDWGRLVPTEPLSGTKNTVDWEAVKHYRFILQKVRDFGMDIMLSLFHHSLPKWAALYGGWKDEKTIKYFLEFTRLAAEEYGDLVKFWVTFNEPHVYAMLTYAAGAWPGADPGLVETATSAFPTGVFGRTMQAMASAHNDAFDILHDTLASKVKKVRVGISHHVSFMRPYGLFDVAPVMITTQLTRYPFVDDVCRKCDFEFVSGAGLKLVHNEEYSDSGRSVHPDGLYRGLLWFHERYNVKKGLSIPFFITENGVSDDTDYIRRPYMIEHLLAVRAAMDKEFVSGAGLKLVHNEEYSDSGRSVHPDGLYRGLLWFHERYNVKKGLSIPFFITENGVSDDTDYIRRPYMIEHLLAVRAAMDKGVPIQGYLFWTTSDNWEWADGYGPKFGLCHVDRANNLARTKRPSYDLWSEICRTGEVTKEQRDGAWESLQAAAAEGRKRPYFRHVNGFGLMYAGGLDVPIQRPLIARDWRFGHYQQDGLQDPVSKVVRLFLRIVTLGAWGRTSRPRMPEAKPRAPRNLQKTLPAPPEEQETLIPAGATA